MSDSWTCPHGVNCIHRGDCAKCQAEINARPDPATMAPQARADEVLALLDTANGYTVDSMHRRLEALVGRPVWTHEMARPFSLMEEAKSWEHPENLAEHVIQSASEIVGPDRLIVVDGR